eukprot:1185782-Prorocentrum_minimum.AAC.4
MGDNLHRGANRVCAAAQARIWCTFARRVLDVALGWGSLRAIYAGAGAATAPATAPAHAPQLRVATLVARPIMQHQLA